MKPLFKILSFALTAHLLIAISSPPLVYHFCGEKIRSIGIGKAKQCDCSHNDKSNNAPNYCEKDCCHEEIYLSEFHPDGVLGTTILAPNPIAVTFLAMFHPTFASTLIEEHKAKNTAFDAHPPARSSDIPVLFQSLLI